MTYFAKYIFFDYKFNYVREVLSLKNASLKLFQNMHASKVWASFELCEKQIRGEL